MQAALIGPHGRITLDSNAVMIGHSPDNQLIINDRQAASHHAEIRPEEQGYSIIDLNSSTGTFLNGLRIPPDVPIPLNTGDTIRIGETRFIYKTQTQSGDTSPANTENVKYDNDPTEPRIRAIARNSASNIPSLANKPPSFQQLNEPLPERPIGSLPTLVAPQKTRRSAPSRGLALLLVALIFLLIVSSASLFIVVRKNQIAAANAKATAQAIQATQTVTAIRKATAAAQATVAAQATTTATIIAGNPDPYPPHTGTLTLYDPLIDNLSSHQWDEGQTSNGSGNCQFKSDGYHASMTQSGNFITCHASNTNFSNFAYQVQMTIISGDCGGMIFRANMTSNNYYLFEICQQGSYDLAIYNGNSGKNLIIPQQSSAIKTGLNTANTIAVVADGNSINLYANNQLLTSYTDISYSHGQIGLIADDYRSSTEVAFSSVKVWTF